MKKTDLFENMFLAKLKGLLRFEELALFSGLDLILTWN